MMRAVDGLLLAFQTLTRIPVPALRQPPDARVLALSGVFYPVVGLVLGGGIGWPELAA